MTRWKATSRTVLPRTLSLAAGMRERPAGAVVVLYVSEACGPMKPSPRS